MLSLWALGASPSLIKQHAERNINCALPPPKFADEATVESLSNPQTLEGALGDERYYQDLVVFFEREVARLGVDEVLQRYLVGDGDLARAVYPRIYRGYVHAIMHIGLGLEFDQPSILAEGLGEALVHHEPWYTEYHDLCRSVAASAAAEQRLSASRSLPGLLAGPRHRERHGLGPG